MVPVKSCEKTQFLWEQIKSFLLVGHPRSQSLFLTEVLTKNSAAPYRTGPRSLEVERVETKLEDSIYWDNIIIKLRV